MAVVGSSGTVLADVTGNVDIGRRVVITVASGKAGVACATTGTSLYAVTAGKKFYMTQLFFATSAACNVDICDEAVPKLTLRTGDATVSSPFVVFDNPIMFDTSIKAYVSSNMSGYYSIVGYEEAE